LNRNDLLNAITLAKPQYDDLYELKDWQIKDAKVKCDILLNCGNIHIAMIKHLITSNEVLDYFQNLYQLINRTIQMVLRKKLNAMEMKKRNYVTTHLETFQSMLNQMVALVVFRSYKKNKHEISWKFATFMVIFCHNNG
jgi:hypothetical protein